MSIDDYIRTYPGGVKALSHPGNKEGQKVLAEARKQYWKESLQPSDPRFKEVYGETIRKQEDWKRKDEDKAKELWNRRKSN